MSALLISAMVMEKNFTINVTGTHGMASVSYTHLKAQAVCARTFVYSQMKNTQYALYGANIDNTTAFQVYNASETKQMCIRDRDISIHTMIRNLQIRSS